MTTMYKALNTGIASDGSLHLNANRLVSTFLMQIHQSG